MLPTAAARNHRRQAAITAAVVVGARRLWRRMRPTGNWGDQYRANVGPATTALVLAGQKAVAAESEGYMAAVLAELDIPAESPTSLNLPGFVGVAGDGRPVDTLLEQTVVHAGETYNRTQDAPAALDDAQAFLDRYVATIMADTARAAESAAMVQRPWVEGWVRMLVPPGDCSRCIVLAGKFYLWNDGFERHPLCNCKHIPAQEEGERFGSLLTNPNDYFDSLTADEQDRIFTKAGAEAIRDGADISQVVNARRGMSTSQHGRIKRVAVYGQQVYITDEGTTRRG
ncbi:MAG TPA: hypothetical protein VFG63_14255, partial [Nocardioidaceae bacterium]|nr:hypothetical protein [Nocardioidaceae bacterium]